MTKKNKKRILWVDDDSKGFLSIFGEDLESVGFQVESVVSLDSAIYLLQNESYDIVITDWLLPFSSNEFTREGGSYLIQKIRDGSLGKNIKEMPVIIFSLAASIEIMTLTEDENQKNTYYFEKYRIGEKQVFNDMVRIIEES